MHPTSMGERGNRRRAVGSSSRTVCLIALGCSASLLASTQLTWASVDLGDRRVADSLADAPVAFVVVALASAVMAGGAVAALFGYPAGLRMTAFAGLTTALAVAGLIVASESLALALSDNVVISLARRFVLGVGTGLGAWAALTSGLVAGVAAAEPLRSWALAIGAEVRERGRHAFVGFLLLPMIVFAVAQLRQQAWLEGVAFGRTLTVNGAALPWIAPVTVCAEGLLIVAIALACMRAWELSALMAAGAGWLANVAAALTVVVGKVLADVEPRSVHLTLAVWLTFAIGLCAAAGGACLLWRPGGLQL